MPKYYTPKAAIRFANQDVAAFKKLAMTVEVCVQVASDHGHKHLNYSGVIRYRLADWRRYTTVWLYGDSVDTNEQDFVQPSISDVSSSTYIENYHVESVLNSGTVYLTGSNFISGTQVYTAGQLMSSTFLNRYVIQVHTSGWFDEQENVPVKVVRPDYYSSTIYTGFSFEERPIVSAMDLTGTYIDGGMALNIIGDYLKEHSNVHFTSGTASVWSNNITFETSHSIGTFTPPCPATGVYAVQVQSPSGLSSSIIPNSHIQVFYHRPVISVILPYNTGAIAGSSSFSIVGSYFLSGAQVFFDTTGVLSQSVVSKNRIDVLSPGHLAGQVQITVVNTEDGQTSVGSPFQYVIPVPTLVDANFNGNTEFTCKTGSAGSDLYITGTNFTGSDATMTLSKISLISGTFVSASTNFTIVSPTEVIYTIGVLTTGSHYDLQVSNSAGTATLESVFEYQDVPVITSIYPISGSVAGGNTITVNGRPFYLGASQVKFGGVLATTEFKTINQLWGTTPQAANLDGGQVDVSVQNYGSIEGVLVNAFEYVPFPTASYVRSVRGNNRVPAETTSQVTLVGARLMADNVGGRGTTIELSSEVNPVITSFIDKTQVSFNVPPHNAGFISLFATNRDIANSDVLVNAIEYVYTPTIVSISQAAVTLAGGTTINVVGTNFINSTDTTVFVGTTQVAATVTDSQHLSFVTPTLIASTYNVTVVNRSTTTSNALPLQYITPPTITSLSITQGPNTGGTITVVNGTGFISGSVSASFAGLNFANSGQAAVSYISPTQVSITTPTTLFSDPPQRGNASLTISVLGLSTTLSNAFFFEQGVAIQSISPTTALVAGTTTITVTAPNAATFVNGVTTVAVDNVNVGYTFVNSAYITFVAPAHAIGGCTVKAANTFLSASTAGLTYAALAPPVITNIVIGTTTCDVNGQAKWGWAGGAAHIQSSGYGDELWGNNFTVADTITIIMVGSPGAPTIITPQFVNSTKLRFTMPASVFAAQLQIVVSNVNGVSNYAAARRNTTPSCSFLLPTIGAYNASTLISLTGTNFISGQTYVELDNGYQMPATVLNSTTLQFTLPPTYNSYVDQSLVTFYIVNSSSMPGEARYKNVLYRTVNPPQVMGILKDVDPPTAGGTQILIVPMYTVNLVGHGMRWFMDYTYVDQGPTNYNTTKYPGNTGSLQTMPPHAAGTVPVVLGYINEAGTKILGGGMTLTYQIQPALVVTATGTVSNYVTTFAAGYIGSPTITTSPQISCAPSGGVPPYTTILELNTVNAPYGDPTLPIVYSTVGGTKYANGFGTISYNDTQAYNSASYRWKVTDSVSTVAYSGYVGVYYNISPAVGGGGGGHGGGGCMIPGTPILMAPDGRTTPIELLRVGDLVWTRPDSGIGPMGYHMVTAVKPTTNLLVKVELEDGRNFTCSINHPLNVRGIWRRADSLQVGEELQGTPTGYIKKLTYLSEGTVIQITVPTAKTYFAGSGLWQHNLSLWKN